MYARIITVSLLAIILASEVCAEPVGVLGLSEVQDGAAIAFWVPLEDGQAVASVRWYNNDGTTEFPAVLLTAGAESGPGDVSNASVVATNVGGETSSWAQHSLSCSVASGVGGLYVIYQLPVGSVPVHRGEGGGAAIGYSMNPDGYRTWLSPDGVEWVEVSRDCSLMVGVGATVDDGSSLRLDRSENKLLTFAAESTEEEVPINSLIGPSPNPFNPATSIGFSMAKAGVVELIVYDIMGRRVSTLASGTFSAGHHEVEWTGCDQAGRSVASGVYLVRMATEEYQQTARMVLVR